MVKLGLSNITRAILALTGVGIGCVALLSKGGAIKGYSIFESPLFFLLAVVLIAIGLYSDKTGYKGINNDGSGSVDEAPGARLNKSSHYESDSGDYGGGGDG